MNHHSLENKHRQKIKKLLLVRTSLKLSLNTVTFSLRNVLPKSVEVGKY